VKSDLSAGYLPSHHERRSQSVIWEPSENPSADRYTGHSRHLALCAHELVRWPIGQQITKRTQITAMPNILNLCRTLLFTFHMGIAHERLLHRVILTWHFNTITNATNRVSNIVKGLGVVVEEHVTHKLASQYLTKYLWGWYWRGTVTCVGSCRLPHEPESAECEVTRVPRVPLARPTEGFSGGSQMPSLYE
jgi:hypothetical protein